MQSNEEFEHDDCPKCGIPSEPAEDVTDQSLRSCPKCGHEWFEDLSLPPQKGKLKRAKTKTHS